MKYKDEHVNNGQYQSYCSNFTLNNLDRETSPNLIIQQSKPDRDVLYTRTNKTQ